MSTTNKILLLFTITLVICVSCVPVKNGVTQKTPTLLLPQATNSPSPTISPSPLPTSAIIPTLAPDEALNSLLQLIKTNGNCELPCWWGVTPGISTGSDIYSVFSPFTGIADGGYLPVTDPRSIEFKLLIDSFTIYLNIDFRPVGNSGPKGIIRVKIQQLNGSKYAPYADVFSRYSLQNILSVYGQPTDVGLIADLHKFDPTSATSFDTYLSYPEKGIYLRYTTLADEVPGNKIRSCPSEAFVYLWLMSPDENNSNQALLTSMNMEWGYSRTSLEDATQMSIDQFYEIFKKSSNQCLESPKAIWTP
jgi:hypothetical protein